MMVKHDQKFINPHLKVILKSWECIYLFLFCVQVKCEKQQAVNLGSPYILFFWDMSWLWFLNCLKYPGFGFVFLLTCSLHSSHTLHVFVFALLWLSFVWFFGDPYFSHTMIGWLCTMPARYWSLLSATIKPKPGYFKQFRNFGQGTSGKKESP